jgi:hypothetical protein
MLAAIGMRLAVVRVPFAVVMRVAIVAGVLMMAERHALARGNQCHALKRHHKRNHDSKQTGELQTHRGILLHGLDGRCTTVFRIGPDL